MLQVLAGLFFVTVAFGAIAVIAVMLVSEAAAIRGALLGELAMLPERRSWNDRVRLVSRRPALPPRVRRSLRAAA